MTGSGGPLTTVADTSGPFESFAFFGGPSINDRGRVAFGAALDGEFGNGISQARTPPPIASSAAATAPTGATVTSTALCSACRVSARRSYTPDSNQNRCCGDD